MGLGFDWRDAVLTWVAGLRRVVGVSMVIIVHFSARGGHELERTGQRFLFLKRGVYFLTVVINATVSTHLCHYLGLDVKPRARILAMVNFSDACSQHVSSLAQNSEGRESPFVDKAKEISKICHKTAGLGEFESTDSVVNLHGERRRMLDVCALRYRSYSGPGSSVRQVAILLGTPVRAGSVCFDSATDRLGLLRDSEGRAGDTSKFIHPGRGGEGGGPWQRFPGVAVRGTSQSGTADASAVFALTARNAVMGKFHEALADGTLHADENPQSSFSTSSSSSENERASDVVILLHFVRKMERR